MVYDMKRKRQANKGRVLKNGERQINVLNGGTEMCEIRKLLEGVVESIKLSDSSNIIIDENSSLYIKLGIQMGILLMHDTMKNTGTDEKENIKKADTSKDKKISKELLNNINRSNEKESLLDFLYKTRMVWVSKLDIKLPLPPPNVV